MAPRARGAVSDGVIAMLFVLAAETMFFAGLISAYIVNRAGAAVWPPYNQPRLPVEVTAVNTLFLLASALTIFLFAKNFPAGKKPLSLLITTIILGIAFITIQGTEWVKLLGYGLTTTSSLYGAFFYTIVGAHAVHVAAGLTILLYLYFALKNSSSSVVSKNRIAVCSMYWYFVAGIWPVLYGLVYLM